MVRHMVLVNNVSTDIFWTHIQFKCPKCVQKVSKPPISVQKVSKHTYLCPKCIQTQAVRLDIFEYVSKVHISVQNVSKHLDMFWTLMEIIHPKVALMCPKVWTHYGHVAK